MVSVADAYHVIEAMIPLYVTMILAYISVKWWKLFTPEDCSGINKFVANIMIPILSFRLISNNNPYDMNLKLVLSDILQKLLALLALAIPTKLISKVHSDWFITGFSVSTLPNTLIMGIPILEATYGDIAAKFLSQIVVLQSVVWYNLLLFMFEYRAAQALGEPETTEPTDVMEAQERTINIEGREAVKSSIFKRKLFLFMLTKLMKNPNSYSTLIGLIWASICFRWGLKLPQMIDKSISLLSDGGLGMAMFSLGIFTASQRKIIACGSRTAAVSMAVRFLVGPALMATACFTTGLKGEILSVAIVQAALPQGIVPFVFAKEYNLHPDILSTGVIFGMLIALPVALSYYILLKL